MGLSFIRNVPQGTIVPGRLRSELCPWGVKSTVYPDSVIQSGETKPVRCRILTGKQLQTLIDKNKYSQTDNFLTPFSLDVLENGYDRSKIEPLLVVQSPQYVNSHLCFFN